MKIFKAKDIVSFKTGKLDSNAAIKGGVYPFFTCSQETYAINSYAFDTECVLLAGNNAAGVFPLKYFKGKFNAYQRTYIIEPLDESVLDIKYFYYFLRPLLQTFQQQATGATTKFLTLKILNSLEVALPDITTQKKIAAILSAYDDLIENNKQRIKLLENMAEELYKEWFVRFRFPNWQNTEFEKGVPKGWETSKMSDLVEFYIGGGWGEENIDMDFSEEAYVIRGTDIPKINKMDFSDKILRFHKESNLKSRMLREYDIIFEVSGGSKDQLLGRNLMMTKNLLNIFNNKVICASFCKLIRFNLNKVNPYFIKYYMKLYYDYDLVGIYQVQSTGISNYQFESFLKHQIVVVPNESLMMSFESIVRPLIEEMEVLGQKNSNLEITKNSLLPRLISGKLSVQHLNIHYPPSMQ